MQSLRKFSSILMVTAALAIMPAFSPPAHGQVTATTPITLTNLPSVVTGGATSNLFTAFTQPTNNVIDVRQRRGMSVFLTFGSTNSVMSSAVTMVWVPTYDGTNFATAAPFVVGANANGLTGVCAYTNWPSALLDNVKKIAPYQLISANASTNTAFITNCVISFGN